MVNQCECTHNRQSIGCRPRGKCKSFVTQYRTNIGNLVSLKCVDVSILVECINIVDNMNDCEVNFNANISDNVINVSNSVSRVFYW